MSNERILGLIDENIKRLETISSNIIKENFIHVRLEFEQFLRFLHLNKSEIKFLFYNADHEFGYYVIYNGACVSYHTQTIIQVWSQYLESKEQMINGEFKNEREWLQANQLGIANVNELNSFNQIFSEFRSHNDIDTRNLNQKFFTPNEKYYQNAYTFYKEFRNSNFETYKDFLIAKFCNLKNNEELDGYRQSGFFNPGDHENSIKKYQEFLQSGFETPEQWQKAVKIGLTNPKDYNEYVSLGFTNIDDYNAYKTRLPPAMKKATKVVKDSLTEGEQALTADHKEIFIQKLYLVLEKLSEIIYMNEKHLLINDHVEFDQVEYLSQWVRDNSFDFPDEEELRWLRWKRNQIIHENSKSNSDELNRAKPIFEKINRLADKIIG